MADEDTRRGGWPARGGSRTVGFRISDLTRQEWEELRVKIDARSVADALRQITAAVNRLSRSDLYKLLAGDLGTPQPPVDTSAR